jgi:hypothetical protein
LRILLAVNDEDWKVTKRSAGFAVRPFRKLQALIFKFDASENVGKAGDLSPGTKVKVGEFLWSSLHGDGDGDFWDLQK